MFPSKDNKDWENYFCPQCYCISHFNKAKISTNYSDGTYRKRDIGKIKKISNKTIFPPIDLPWSTITFLRWEHISSILSKYCPIENFHNKTLLDYGGYNGLTSYGINEFFGLKEVTVADLDIKGLNFAKNLGFKIVDLSKTSLKKKKYDLVIMVHVLEHLENPIENLKQVHNNIHLGGIIYLEVPNLFKIPLSDNSHLSMFSLQSIDKIFADIGYKVLKSGFVETRKETIDFNYFYFSKKESIYILAQKLDNKFGAIKINANHSFNLENPDKFRRRLAISYAKTAILEVSVNIFKKIIYLFKYFLFYFLIGLINYLGYLTFKNYNSYKFFSLLKKFLKR